MKIILIVFLLIVLWYAFGRKWMFINSCKKTAYANEESFATYTDQDKINYCQKKYKDFIGSSNVNFLPIAFY